MTQATTLLESTRATIPQLQISLQQARERPEHAARAADGRRRGAAGGPEEIPKAPAKVAVGVPAEMLRRRPDIRSAELCAAAQCARIGVAKAELYPELLAVRHDRAPDHQRRRRRPHEPRSPPSSLFYSVRPADQLALLQLRPHREQRARRGRAVPAAARRLPRHRAQGGPGGGRRAGRLPQRPGGRGVRAELRRPPPSGRWRSPWCSTGRAPWTSSACSTRSARCCSSRTRLAQTRSSVATNLIALYKALGGGWELRQGQPVVPESTRDEMKERTNWGDMLSQPRAPETRTSPPPAKP